MISSHDASGEDQGPAAEDRPLGWRPYYVLFVLALVYLFSSIDRTLISVLAEPIKREFGLSDGQLGLLTGLAFAISYSLAGIPLGLLVDRLKRTHLLAGLVSVWSALTFLSGMASSALTLAFARIGVGASEAGASPASMSLITDYFPARKRGFALSLFYMSTPISIGITFALGGWLASQFGWRTAYFMAGGPGLLLALLIILTIREPTRGRLDPVKAEEARQRYRFGEAMKTLVRIRPLLLILLAGVSVVAAQAGIGAFSSPFLIRTHGLSVEEAGYAIGAIKAPTGIVGILIGGLLADYLARRSKTAGLSGVAFAMLLAGPFVALAMLTQSWTLALACIGTFNFLNYLYYGATFAAYMSLAPVHMRGALAGTLAVAMTLGGYGLGPPFVGVASDLLGGLGVAEPLRWALVLAGGFFVLASLLFLLATRAIRRMGAAAGAQATSVPATT
jgi:predicted MFS family arabinose efflux permease